MAKLRATPQRKGVAKRPVEQTQYAPEPTAEEYKAFPPGYRLENGSWPVEDILEERGKRGREEYLVQWRSHPYTHQAFRPSWVSRGEVTAHLLASWKESKSSHIPPGPAAIIINDNQLGAATESLVPPAASTGDVHSRKEQHLIIASNKGQEASYTLEGSLQRLKRQKTRRIISDGSSESEEEAKTQTSASEKSQQSQTTASTATGDSLRSPPPEIEDSQESEPQQTSEVSVRVPPLPTDFEDYVPVNSSIDLQSLSQIPTALEVHLSGEATASDYPTPESVQWQSPAVSDNSSALFFPEATQTLPRGSPLASRLVDRNPKDLDQSSNAHATHGTSSGPDSSVQVRASGTVLQSEQGSLQTSLPSAQPNVAQSTSPVHETQVSLGVALASVRSSARFEAPSTQQAVQKQQDASQTKSAKASGTLSLVQTPDSPFKTQVSPSQTQKHRLFRRLHQDGIESWTSQDSSHPSLQPPFQSSEQQVRATVKATATSKVSRVITGPFAGMAAPSQRPSPRMTRASTPSRASRGTTITLQEQLFQSRATRQRNAASASPVDASTKAPAIPLIREPTPVQLTTRTSNPSLPKVEPPEADHSSVLQLDGSSEDRNEVAQSNGKPTASAQSLPIQESIEMDEPEKPDSTQDSSILESGEPQENRNIIGSPILQLLPNYPILLPGEFAIPLHAEGKTQDAYREALQAKHKPVSKYLRRGSSSSTPSSNGSTILKNQANEMSELVSRLDSVVSLIDLGYDGMMTQSSFSGPQLARYTVKASSKFAFIKILIDTLQPYECSLVIFGRAGPLKQVFEHFFSTFEIASKTYTNSGEVITGSASSGNCTVHLVTTGQKPRIQLRPGPALVIAFDTSYDPRSEYVLSLRGEEGRQLPVIHLLVSNSSEHVERCLPVNMPSPQRNRLLIQSIVRGAPHMGKILSGYNDVTLEYYSHLSGGTRIMDDDMMRREQVMQKMPEFHLKRLAQKIGKALIDKEFSTEWMPSPPMPPLQLEDIPGLVAPQLQLPSPSPVLASPVGTPGFRKRLLDGDVLDSPGGSKRQRLTPVPGTSPHDYSEASQIHHLQHALKAAKDEAASEKLDRMGAEDSRDKARGQLQEWRQSVSDLQKRLEYHREQDHKARSNAKKLGKDAERFTQLRERDAAEREALKTQNKQLQGELLAARQALKDAGGDTAALEVAREEARTASAALAKSEKELTRSKEQGEYFRVQYQAAMTDGRSHQNEAEELQSKVKALEIDASQEKRRLKLVNFDDAAKAHLDRIEKLEWERKTLETMNKKLSLENAGLKANRGVSTRASSVQPPGSPRAKSRAGSPVPGLAAIVAAQHAGSRASALRHER